MDNGSDQNCYAFLEERIDDAALLRSETNLGFGQGNNMAIDYALEQGANYVLLVNNDTVVDSAMVYQLVQAMESKSNLGVVGPIIYYQDPPDRVWFAGYRIQGEFYVLRKGLHLEPPLAAIELVDFVSGCGMMLRREALDQVGGFAPAYFMYYEDLDLCIRFKEAGWKIGCVTDASMWHAVSASSGGTASPMKQYHQVRSSIIFYRQHTSGLMFFINMALRLTHAGYMLILYLMRGMLSGALFRRYFQGLREGIESGYEFKS
jgi:hypothetical protein